MDLSGLSDSDVSALATGDMSKVSDEGLQHIAGGGTQPDNQGAAQAGLEHFGNAASLGYLPHLQAMAEKPMAKVMDAATGNNVSDSLPDYVDRRDQNIKRLGDEEKAHPYASLAGSVGGSLASSLPLSAGLLKLPGLASLASAQAAKGAGILGQTAALGARTAGSGLTVGAIGGASNPGDTEGIVDPAQMSDRGKNAAISSMIGVPLHLAGEGVATGGKWASDQLKDFAEKSAFKALGPYQRNVLQNSGDINDIGRTVLDKGVIGKIPQSYETLSDRAGAAKEVAGENIGKVVEDLSNKEGVPSISRKEMANNLRKQLIADESVPGVASKNERMNALIDELEHKGEDGLSLKEARDLKSGVKKQIKWDRLPQADIPLDEQFYRALHGELKSGEENIAANLAKQGQIPNGSDFLNAKQEYGNLGEAQKISKMRSDKETANRFLGLTDTLAGGTGAAVGAFIGDKAGGYEGAKMGAAVGGGLGAMGNKMARTYGNQVAAKSADGFASLLAKSPQLANMIGKNPAMVPKAFDDLRTKEVAPSAEALSNPDFLTKFKQNPRLIDQLSNESLKRSIRNALKNQDEGRGVANEPSMPLDQAREKFRQGN